VRPLHQEQGSWIFLRFAGIPDIHWGRDHQRRRLSAQARCRGNNACRANPFNINISIDAMDSDDPSIIRRGVGKLAEPTSCKASAMSPMRTVRKAWTFPIHSSGGAVVHKLPPQFPPFAGAMVDFIRNSAQPRSVFSPSKNGTSEVEGRIVDRGAGWTISSRFRRELLR